MALAQVEVGEEGIREEEGWHDKEGLLEVIQEKVKSHEEIRENELESA